MKHIQIIFPKTGTFYYSKIGNKHILFSLKHSYFLSPNYLYVLEKGDLATYTLLNNFYNFNIRIIIISIITIIINYSYHHYYNYFLNKFI